MNLSNREDRIAAAGEYVLRQLDASDRQTFEDAMAKDPGLREEVQWWERRIALIGLRQTPIAPRPMLWLDLQHRLRSNIVSIKKSASRTATTAWASLATAAALLLGVGLYIETSKPMPEPQIVTQQVKVPVTAVSYVAMLEVPKSTMKWSVSVTPDSKQLVVRATGDVPAAAKDKDAELWLITDAGPVSLGVIPVTGEERRIYTAALAFASGKTLAISLEPRGGSPTGSPTGPVVSTGAILQAG